AVDVDESVIVDEALLDEARSMGSLPGGQRSDVGVAGRLDLVDDELRGLVHAAVGHVVIAVGSPRRHHLTGGTHRSLGMGEQTGEAAGNGTECGIALDIPGAGRRIDAGTVIATTYTQQRSEEHTSELQSRFDLVCRLL